MKKNYFTLLIACFMFGVILIGCQSSEKKIENAESNVQNAQNKLSNANQALKQAISDSIQQFKKDANAIILHNEKEMADLRAKIVNQKKENKALYEKKLGELEQKNLEMRNKLENFDDQENSKWQTFKREFNHDMNKLGEAIKDIGKNNSK